ncbi:EndoU domain-containing protein [Rhodococcus marinonascens]|uniref:EndoU domain-containing protein n=1 Tax=Rhodococcus marinonascens TaxID=38311 RepID=UPI000934FC00|nr:EndoU domain-containing protein [Rhodococcus marinonascens]
MPKSVAELVATLQYTTGPHRGVIHTRNPALSVGGSIPPPSMSAGEASSVSAAASMFDYSDACEMWRHLADPAPAKTKITSIDDDALVASLDPEMIYHVEGIDCIWRNGRDPRTYCEVPARAVLDHLLDMLDNQHGLLADPPTRAHDLWNFFVRPEEDEYSWGPFTVTNSRVTESIGPYTGWRLILGGQVRVEPLGRNNFRSPEQVRVIQDVVDLAGSTADDWCDAHDALQADDLSGSRTDAVAAKVLASGLGSDDRRLIRELLLDLVLWQAGVTSGTYPWSYRYESLGSFIPRSETARGSTYHSIGLDGSGQKIYIHSSESGFEFLSYVGESIPAISEPALRVTVSQDHIRRLCESLGVPSYAHPLPVVSLFADEICVLGPQEWLRRKGAKDWTEDRPTPVPTPSAHDLASDFVTAMHRPPAGGHGSGVGLPGKTEFPTTWSNDTVMVRVRETTVEPHTRSVIGWTVFDEGEFDGVWVCVVWRRQGEQSRLVTAYPVAGDDVVFNEFPDDYPQNLVIPAAWDVCDDVNSAPEQDTHLIRNAGACSEPYEAILAALHVAEKFQILLPLERMNTLAQLMFSGFFDDSDEDELVEVFSGLATRDYPDNNWGPH